MAANAIWGGATSTAWALAGNWSPASIPVSTDTVYLDSTAANNIAGSDQSAVTLAAMSVSSTFTNLYGDLDTPLKIKCTLMTIHTASGSAVDGGGTGRFNHDGSTAATTITVLDSKGSSQDTGLEPIRIKAVNSANILNALGGRIGVATNAIGDVATFGTINVDGSAVVNLAAGLTLTTLNTLGGTTTLNNLATTVNHSGGSLTTFGDYAIATLNLRNGATVTCNHQKTAGNIFTTVTSYGGTLDFSNNPYAVNIGTLVIDGDTIIRENYVGQVTWTTLTRNNGSFSIQ